MVQHEEVVTERTVTHDHVIYADNIIRRARLIGAMNAADLAIFLGRIAQPEYNASRLDYMLEDLATTLARNGLVPNEGLFDPEENPSHMAAL